MSRRLVLTLFSILLAACGGSEGFEVSDAWARPTPPIADAAAFYVTVANRGGPDVLQSAASDRCAVAELHDHVLEDDIMMMREVGRLEISGDESLVMEPGGLHIMCLGVTEQLVEGDEVIVVLTFESGSELVTEVTVEQR